MCIKDSDGKYVEIQKTGGRLFETAVEKLLPGSSANGSGEPTFLNTLHSVMRREVVPVSPNTLVPQDQPGYAIVETAGGITGKAVASDYPPVKQTKAGFTMSNASIAIVVANGRISSILDVALK